MSTRDWTHRFVLLCASATLLHAQSAQAEPKPNGPASLEATAPSGPSVEPAPVPAPPKPSALWYASEFTAGVAFTTAQVTAVWAIIDWHEPSQRDRLLLVTAIAAGTAALALTAAVFVAAGDAVPPRAAVYVAPGSVGVVGTF